MCGRDFDGFGGGTRGDRLRHCGSGPRWSAVRVVAATVSGDATGRVQSEGSRGGRCRVGRRVWGGAGTIRLWPPSGHRTSARWRRMPGHVCGCRCRCGRSFWAPMSRSVRDFGRGGVVHPLGGIGRLSILVKRLGRGGSSERCVRARLGSVSLRGGPACSTPVGAATRSSGAVRCWR